MTVWDASQLRALLDCVRDDRLRALWTVAAITGMRRGEVCGLQWADLNLDAGQLAECLAWGEAWTDSGYVFVQQDRTPLRSDAVTRAFEEHLTNAALPRLRLHDLRHSHATLGLAAGIPAKVMSERLGHSKVGTIDLYSHVMPGMQDEAAAKIGELVRGS
jgi:integrase